MAESRIVGYMPPSGSSDRTKILRLKVSDNTLSLEGSILHEKMFFQVISADNLAKKDIFGASDPYVRIDLVSNNNDEVTSVENCSDISKMYCTFLPRLLTQF